MRLNLPILDQLADCKNILIAGMGGGFDVYCGLPIFLTLREMGMNVHLANYSFVDVTTVRFGEKLTRHCVGVTGIDEPVVGYFPEYHLAKWHESAFSGEKLTVWCFQKTGVRPLLEAYRALVAHLNVDAILLIDGGVDSLMHGDEAEVGTMVEDTISLIAVDALEDIPTKLMACVALGAEQDISYAHAFENIAELTKAGAFYGACALTPGMAVAQQYDDAVMTAQRQPVQDPSVINSSLVSALRGEFGNFHLTAKTRGSTLWISPLMPIYWFFELSAVAERNLLYDDLLLSDSTSTAFQVILQTRQMIPIRRPGKVRL